MESKEASGSKSENSSPSKKGSGQNSKSAHGNNGTQKQYQNQHHKNQGKTGRPCREIYRPPSLRSKTSRNPNPNSNSVKRDLDHTHNDLNPNSPGIGNSPKNNGNAPNFPNKSPSNPSNQTVTGSATSGGSSTPNSPHVSRHPFNFNLNGPNPNANQQRNLCLNVNATEFPMSQQQFQGIQQQQLLSLIQLSQLDPALYNEVTSAGLYSLQQSKSLSNLNLLLQRQQQLSSGGGPGFNMNIPFNLNLNALAYLQNQQNANQQSPQNFGNNFRQEGPSFSQFNKLSQSKSSGSIPEAMDNGNGGRPRVRFDLESGGGGTCGVGDDVGDEATRNMLRNSVENRFSALDLNGHQQRDNPAYSQGQPQLQKSRTGFLLNLYSQPQPQQNQNPGILKQDLSKSPGPNIKRSRSFGPGSLTTTNSGYQNHSQKSGPGIGSGCRNVPMLSVHSVYSDFQISRWPKRVQETVTTAVTAVERVAARQQIEMVNIIFDAMLTSGQTQGNSDPNISKIGTDSNLEKDTDSDSNWRNSDTKSDSTNKLNETDKCDTVDPDPSADADFDSDTDLSTAAVHIFLYFIQREKDRTVMESLLNTCFATYQMLFANGANTFSGQVALKSGIFLRFISALYFQVKLLRRQRQLGGGVGPMDEMSFSLLALLCDSCLALLRSRFSNDPALMGTLFTVMTSQGRDMEGTFPLKMKQLLAAVRDALLGLGPYSNSGKGPLCPLVQKTLMQLIELHAANWALPASAVRYYYSTNTNNGNSNNNTHKGRAKGTAI